MVSSNCRKKIIRISPYYLERARTQDLITLSFSSAVYLVLLDITILPLRYQILIF